MAEFTMRCKDCRNRFKAKTVNAKRCPTCRGAAKLANERRRWREQHAPPAPRPDGPLVGCPVCRAYGQTTLGRPHHLPWCTGAVSA